MRRPPRRRKGAPHSAVTPGAAKLRAVTTSKVERSALRAATSARCAMTATRPDIFRRSMLRWRNADRVVPPSRRHQVRFGVSAASTIPGTPPPLPRSRAREQSSGKRSRNSSECSICRAMSPGPRNPSCFASSRTPTTSSSCSELRSVGDTDYGSEAQSGTTTTRRFGSSPSETV